MNKSATFSIICPAYNSEKSLTASIESIIKQTFSDWELILVDDGSSDSTGPICDKYASIDKRIKAIHQSNTGQSKARLNGVQASTGEYILFLDSDDEYMPNALEIIDSYIARNEQFKVIAYNAVAIDNSGKENPVYNLDDTKSGLPVVEFFLKRRISYFWSICFKRELFNLPKDVLDYFCSLSYSEDLYLIYNIVKNLENSDFIIIDQKLYRYNYNNNSLTKNQNAKKALDRFSSFNNVYESIYSDDHKAFSLIAKDVRDIAGWTYLSAARKIATEYDYAAYLPLIKQIRSSFIFKNMNQFKKDKYNYIGYIFLKLKMYKRFRKYIIKKEGKQNEN